jgi:hypothetical protein
MKWYSHRLWFSWNRNTRGRGGSWGSEMSRFPRFLHSGLTVCSEVVGTLCVSCPLPSRRFMVHVSVTGWVDPRAILWLDSWKIVEIKHWNHLIEHFLVKMLLSLRAPKQPWKVSCNVYEPNHSPHCDYLKHEMVAKQCWVGSVWQDRNWLSFMIEWVGGTCIGELRFTSWSRDHL